MDLRTKEAEPQHSRVASLRLLTSSRSRDYQVSIAVGVLPAEPEVDKGKGPSRELLQQGRESTFLILLKLTLIGNPPLLNVVEL